MLLPIKPVCKEGKARRDGTSIIFLQYCFSVDKRTTVNTEIAIPSTYWNRKRLYISNDLPDEYGNARELNERLKQLWWKAESIVSLAIKKNVADPVAFLKETFSPDADLSLIEKKITDAEVLKAAKDVKKNLDLFFQMDDYINAKGKKATRDMTRIYRNTRDHLKAFEEFRKVPITFDCLDLTFYEEFVDFLMYEYVQKRRRPPVVGLKTNTVGKTIKQFRTFLRNRIRKRIIPPIDMEGWIILEEEVDAVYLNRQEIAAIYNADLSAFPQLEDYRNDFVLGCLTGLRFSDFSKLDMHDVKGDMLYKKQQKSDHWVVIPLRPEAQAILQKRFEKCVPPQTNVLFNRHIKTIAQLAGITEMVKHSYKKANKEVVEVKPKHAWVTSHTCRRSFCTNEFLAGTPVELIMKISGHKSVKDFYKYIRISPEEAGRKMKELWQQRGMQD